MIITISGNAGSGKSTVAKVLKVKLGMKRYYMGGILRDIAKQKGLTLEEFSNLRLKNSSFDKEIDEYQKNLANKDNIIVEGRTSFYFIPNSFKIFLKCSLDVAAERIFKDKREEESGTLKEIKELLIKRSKQDEQRYLELYGINPFDESNYDLVIDTSNLRVDEVVEEIISFIS